MELNNSLRRRTWSPIHGENLVTLEHSNYSTVVNVNVNETALVYTQFWR